MPRETHESVTDGNPTESTVKTPHACIPQAPSYRPAFLSDAVYVEQLPAIHMINGQRYANYETVVEMQGGNPGRVGHWYIENPAPYHSEYARYGLARREYEQIIETISDAVKRTKQEIHWVATFMAMLGCLWCWVPMHKHDVHSAPYVQDYFRQLNPSLHDRGIQLSFHCQTIEVTSPIICEINVYHTPL